ncbi:MAG: sigma-70 family RNA polymerase sigma factor [Cyanobacteria bacterium P01_F01_bin.13]
MHSRQSLLDIFSTFIELQADGFRGWFIDVRLRRSFEAHQAQLERNSSEEFWSLYWYARWQQDPESIAFAHLSAYLQETCYWTAQKAMRALGHGSYRLSDCFQLISLDINKVLAGYDPNRGASLKGYASFVCFSLLRDTLRQRQEADISTDWTLLRRVGKQRLMASLRQAGLSSVAMAQYRLAWACYTVLYSTAKVPTRKLRSPEPAQWIAISKRYNTERLQQLSEPGPALTSITLEQRLAQCASWIRAYSYPPLVSLNNPYPNRQDGAFALQDELSTSLPPLTTLIELEDLQKRQAKQNQLNTLLTSVINELTPDTQMLLALYYQAQLTQKQIAHKLDMKQCTVSRRLARAREALLKAVTIWSGVHISPTPDLLSDASVALEEWLTVHYCNRPQL